MEQLPRLTKHYNSLDSAEMRTGKTMVVKLLRSLGQTDQQLQQATAPKASRADVEPAKVAKTEEQKQREEYMKNIMEEQVVFEYAWVPSETKIRSISVRKKCYRCSQVLRGQRVA